MSVLRRCEKTQDEHPDFAFFCPGCKCGHAVWVTRSKGPKWTFNGNMEKPTFQPSLLITHEWDDCSQVPEDGWTEWAPNPNGPDGTKSRSVKPEFKHLIIHHRDVCHVIVTNGLLNYCGDSTHEFAGKSIPMEEF